MVAFRRCPRKLRAVLRTCRAAEHVLVSRGWPVGAEMAEIGQGRARRPEKPFGGILPALPMRRPNNRPPRAHTAMCNLFDPCEHPPVGISLHDFSVKRSRGARTLTWRSQKGLSPSRAGAPTSPDAGSHLVYARSTVRAHLRRVALRPGGGIQVLHGPPGSDSHANLRSDRVAGKPNLDLRFLRHDSQNRLWTLPDFQEDPQA